MGHLQSHRRIYAFELTTDFVKYRISRHMDGTREQAQTPHTHAYTALEYNKEVCTHELAEIPQSFV